MAEFATGGIVPVPADLGETGLIPVLSVGCDYIIPDAGHRERSRDLLRRLNESFDPGEDESR